MHHVFIYALPTNNSKYARISEIAAVHSEGFRYSKSDIKGTYLGKSDETTPVKMLANLRSQILPSSSYVVVSYCNEITRTLLKTEYEACNIEDIFSGRAWIDINQLAWPLIAGEFIRSRTLETLCQHFKIDFRGTARSDSADICTAILQVYKAIMMRYKTALHGESVVRDVGGDTLEEIRRMVGF